MSINIYEEKKELTADEKYNLITRNLQEVIKDDLLREILKTRDPVIYWGTASTSSPHLGYIFCLLKLADLLDAGCYVKVLIADLHAVLDSLKSTFESVSLRAKYYELMIRQILILLKADTSKLEFVLGSDFQLSKEYTLDVYRANSVVSYKEARHAGADVVKQTDDPNMNSLLYPSLQALDLHYLKADAHYSGIDQRKINVHANKILPKLGMKKGFFLMNYMVPALTQHSQKQDVVVSVQDGPSSSESNKEIKDTKKPIKMSASDPDSKIDLLDSAKIIKKKINKAYCLEGDIEDNSPLTLVRMVIFPVLNRLGLKFTINRDDKYGGNITYDDYTSLESDFKDKKLYPGDLKSGISDSLSDLLKPIREFFEIDVNKKIYINAYKK